MHITLHLRLLWLRCMKQACRNIVVFLRFSHKVVLGVPFVVVQIYLGLANQGETCGRSHVMIHALDAKFGNGVWLTSHGCSLPREVCNANCRREKGL